MSACFWGTLALVLACGPPTGGRNTTAAGQAKSVPDVGGLSALEIKAKKDGQLNVIALPRDWANYGAVLDAFKAKYGISITSDNPDGSSQDEVDAVNQLSGTSRAPDVLDIGWPSHSPTPHSSAP